MNLGAVKRALTAASYPVTAALARARVYSPRPPRFAGAFPSREAALASLPPAARSGYDNEDIADVSYLAMCEIKAWDYPVLYWLQRLQKPGLRVLDAGGHLGTKYIAFRDHIAVNQLEWTIYDVPGIVRAARKGQAAGIVPDAIRFIDDLTTAGPTDLFLGSGLMQYSDRALPALLECLPARPSHVILNKVATTDGPQRVTLERIGSARVPYQIHTREIFESGLISAGYDISDSWLLPDVRHRIPTHPWLGESESRGYMLTLK